MQILWEFVGRQESFCELWTFWGHMKQMYGQIYYTTHLFQSYNA